MLAAARAAAEASQEPIQDQDQEEGEHPDDKVEDKPEEDDDDEEEEEKQVMVLYAHPDFEAEFGGLVTRVFADAIRYMHHPSSVSSPSTDAAADIILLEQPHGPLSAVLRPADITRAKPGTTVFYVAFVCTGRLDDPIHTRAVQPYLRAGMCVCIRLFFSLHVGSRVVCGLLFFPLEILPFESIRTGANVVLLLLRAGRGAHLERIKPLMKDLTGLPSLEFLVFKKTLQTGEVCNR